MTESHVPDDAPWTPPELAPELVRKLATGSYDALAGRYIHAEHDDVDDLLARIDEIARERPERDPAAALMRTILCFGDSNTWGYIPGSDGERFPREVRWPVRLAARARRRVGGDRRRAERPHRDDRQPRRRGRNGLPYLVPCLHSHAPVDLLVIFLGTNDVGYRFRLPSRRRALGRPARQGRARRPRPGPTAARPRSSSSARRRSPATDSGRHFAEVCAELGCELLDLDGVASYVDRRRRRRASRRGGARRGRRCGRGARAPAARVSARAPSRSGRSASPTPTRTAGCGSMRSRATCRTSPPTTSLDAGCGAGRAASGSCAGPSSTSCSRSLDDPRVELTTWCSGTAAVGRRAAARR